MRLTQKIAIFFVLAGILAAPLAQAQSDFNPQFIISDQELLSVGNWSRFDVQNFLDSKGGYLRNLVTTDASGTRKTAADIIFDAAVRYQVNPKYLLVTLQKEQSLITDDSPTNKQLDWAAGYAVCDSCSMSDPRIQKHKGFGQQVDDAAGIMRWYYDNRDNPIVIKKDTPILKAFERIDEILRDAISGITELIASIGIINVDFADVRTIMHDAGSALMGIGRAAGENRAIEAARQAIDSPLLELSIDGAMGILYNITGGPDMTMYEVEEASKAITEAAHPEANIIFGAIVDDAMSGEIKITVIATGFENEMAKPTTKRRVGDEHGGYAPPAAPPPTIPFFGNNQQSNNNFNLDFEPIDSPPPPRRERLPEPPAAPRRERMPEPMPPTIKDKDDELEVPAFIRRKLR
jgi:hypothetical protein